MRRSDISHLGSACSAGSGRWLLARGSVHSIKHDDDDFKRRRRADLHRQYECRAPARNIRLRSMQLLRRPPVWSLRMDCLSCRRLGRFKRLRSHRLRLEIRTTPRTSPTGSSMRIKRRWPINQNAPRSSPMRIRSLPLMAPARDCTSVKAQRSLAGLTP